jgi:hypothetical protein
MIDKDVHIRFLEQKIRAIFAKDIITKLDIDICDKCIADWKHLTEYVSDKTPVLLHTVDEIIDKEPNWKTKKEKK